MTLSLAAHRVVKLMAAAEKADALEDAEIVCEGQSCWVGLNRTTRAVVTELLRKVLVRSEDCNGGVERYTLNSDGRRAVDDPTHEGLERT